MSRDALLIAVNQFATDEISSLSFAEADARGVGEVLRTRCGFNVRTLTGADASRSKILRTIQSLPGGDTLLVFYATHGQMQHGCYLLHTADSRMDGRATVTFDELVTQCAVNAGYKEVAFILDACRNQSNRTVGPRPLVSDFEPAQKSPGYQARDIVAMASAHFQSITKRTRQLSTNREDVAWVEVLYGCSDGEYSYEDKELGHGLFSYGLVGSLAGYSEPVLDLRGWADRATRFMARWTREKPDRPLQQPMHYSQTGREGIKILDRRDPTDTYEGRVFSGDEGLKLGTDVIDLTMEMSDLVAQIDQGRLILLHPIGQGGMGTVWLARDGRLDRLVALKCPNQEILDGTKGRKRFLNEARTAARLRHSSVVDIYNIHELKQHADDKWTIPIIEMEYVDGPSLRAAVENRHGGLEPEEVVEMGQSLCMALTEAHRAGIIHRDIKPDNILIGEDGIAKLVDFGIASAAVDSTTRYTAFSLTGAGLGSLGYSAPEQLQQGEADARSDIFALGATLYFALTGMNPSGILSRTHLPPTLVPVIEKACHPDPNFRYKTADEFRTALLAAGRPKAGVGYVERSAACPKCGRENSDTSRACRHCGASLSSLFRPCPSCETEIRVDVAFCTNCGANVALECLKLELAEVHQQEDIDRVVELAQSGIEQFPQEQCFHSELKWAKDIIARNAELPKELAAAEDNSQRIEILQQLLKLYPEDQQYAAALQELTEKRNRLQTEIEEAKCCFDFIQMWESCKKGLEEYPSEPFFKENLELAEKRLETIASLAEQLETAENKTQELALLETLVAMQPNNEEFARRRQELNDLRQSLREEIVLAARIRDDQKVIELATKALEVFPKDDYFIERRYWAKNQRLRQQKMLFSVIVTTFVLAGVLAIIGKFIDIISSHSHSTQKRPEVVHETHTSLIDRISQQVEKHKLEVDPAQSDFFSNTIGMKMLKLPNGFFNMGSSAEEEDQLSNEIPVHNVGIFKTIFMSETEVTQKQWKELMVSTPWIPHTNSIDDYKRPATFINWHEAEEFCKRLSEREGLNYRLPTEAEWEYACRAGTRTKYSFEDENDLPAYAWFNRIIRNSYSSRDKDDWEDIGEYPPQRVDSKKPNAWGLYDMHGNVSEWCQDWYDPDYYKTSPVNDPTGPADGKNKVCRGGSILSDADQCRSAYRGNLPPQTRFGTIGFRVVCEFEQTKQDPRQKSVEYTTDE